MDYQNLAENELLENLLTLWLLLLQALLKDRDA
jgi:hypothetical protein